MNQHLNWTPKLKEVSKIEFSLENMLLPLQLLLS